MKCLTRVPRIIALTALLLGLGASAGAEPVAWDGERAAALAGQLAKAVEALRDAVRSAPTPTLASGQARSQEDLMDDLRRIEGEYGRLQRELQSGKGRDETLSSFKQVDLLRRDAGENARRMFLSQPVLEKVEAARALARELAGLYGVDFEPALEERSE
jgi:hypothetical protein